MSVVVANRYWTWGVSLFIHALVIFVLFFLNLNTPRDTNPSAISVEVWAPAPQTTTMFSPPVEVVPKIVHSVQPQTSAQVEPPAEVNLGDKKKKEKINHVDKAENEEKQSKPTEAPQRKITDTIKNKEKIEPLQKTDKKPSTRYNEKPSHYIPNTNDLLEGLDQKKPNTKVMEGVRGTEQGGGGSSGVKDEWINQVKAKITPLVREPLDLAGNPKVIVSVTLLPTLEINRVVLLKSSGNKAYDEAVQRAIIEAKTFPKLPSGAKFSDGYRQFNMEFRPK